MYKIGDKIVYPMHGAGVIEEVEIKTILDEKREYYVLKVPCGDMKIMIPVNKCTEIGVRAVISEEETEHVLGILASATTEMSNNWNRRCRENMDKLKTGDIKEVAEVVRNLMRAEREKTLSTGEKKLLTNARQILMSELILAKNMYQEDIEQLIENKV